MRQALYHLFFPAMLLLPMLSIAQTFNHLYPSGANQPGIFAQPNNGGYHLVSNVKPDWQTVQFIHIQTDGIGAQLSADTMSFINDWTDKGTYTLLSDGNYLFAKEPYSNMFNLTKLAADGTVIWAQTYSLPLFEEKVIPTAIAEGYNGELFHYGATVEEFGQYGRYFLIKTSPDGTALWENSYVFSNNEPIYSPRVDAGAATSDGGFLMATTSSYNEFKYLLLFDNQGNMDSLTSVTSFNNNPSLVAQGSSMKAAFSYTQSTGSLATYNSSSFLRQYNLATGQMDWETQLQPYDAPSSAWPQQTFITAMVPTGDGGYIVSGHGSATGQASRFFLAKLSGTGEILWQKFDYGFTAVPQYLSLNPDGGILVSGLRDGHTWMMLTDNLGNIGCATVFTNASWVMCQGETYEFGGQTLDSTGQYIHYFQEGSPCDSIVTLDLTVTPLDTFEAYTHLCIGEIDPNTGIQYLQTGYFTDTTVMQPPGCPNLIINNVEVDSFYYLYAWGTVPYGYEYCGQIITEPGVYGCTDTSAFGCITISSFEVTNVVATKNKLEETIGLSVSPNLFCEAAQLRFNLPTSATVSAFVFDAQGRRTATLLSDEKLPSGEQQLSLHTDDWPSGVYFLQCRVDGQMGMLRMVKLCR